MFSHEKLDVYQCAVQFLAFTSNLLNDRPPGNSAVTDQLKRAALSIPLNIAEGVGRTTTRERSRAFVVARGSAFECAAALDACLVLGVSSPSQIREGKELLGRVVSMLTRMIGF